VTAGPMNDAGATPPPTVNTAGVPIASVTDCTVTGTMPQKVDRYYLGATGLKAEPVLNDYPTVGGTLTADFNSQADFYDRFVADSSAWLGLTFLASPLGATGFVETLQITVPDVRFTGQAPQLGGLDIIQLQVPFEGTFDGTNPGIQIVYITSDTAI
jgi:hypothetical protein